MPLTEFQSKVALVLAQQRTPDSYLAGGAALHIKPESLRYSNDLDYFNDSVTRVSSAFEDDRVALQKAHYAVEVLLQVPGFVRVLVRKNSEATKVEWVHDTAFRFLPVLRSAEAGYLLHPVDLAINKLLALVGRDEPRDYLDTVYAHSHILPLGGLVWAACGKDPGFTPEFLLDLLRRKGRYRPEDFARLHLHGAPDLVATKRTWLDALEEASLFVQSLPPEDVGCLYYHAELATFVGALPLPNNVVRHFGRPGGLLPIVSDT
jgi:hypothetical protein